MSSRHKNLHQQDFSPLCFVFSRFFCIKWVLPLLLITMLTTPTQVHSWRRKTIKEHTRNITDFNLKYLFPPTWADELQKDCEAQFYKSVFTCQHKMVLNTLNIHKQHRLLGTPQAGWIFAYATFMFVRHMKLTCYENEFELNCGCQSCRLDYPPAVCNRLMNRSEEDSFGGCDPKSRHVMKILDHFKDNYLAEVQSIDEEMAYLIDWNMEIGRKEALKFVRKTIAIQEGEKCECGPLVCPDQNPRECLYHFMVLESIKVAHNLFKLYEESVFGTLTNQSVWVDSEGNRISKKQMIHIKEYEPDCAREIDGRKCVDGNVWDNDSDNIGTGKEINLAVESTAKVKCHDLCNFCETNYNYTVSTAIEDVSCNCEPVLNPETLHLTLVCAKCLAVVHSCRAP